MTYVVVLGAMALLLRATRPVNERLLLGFMLACLLATFAALRGDDVSSDFTIYRDWYHVGADADGLLERPPILESLFLAAMAAFNAMGVPFRAFVWMVAACAIGLKFYTLQRISQTGAALLAGSCCYLFSDFLLHDFTQLRAGLAIGIFMLSLVFLRERNTPAFLCATLLGSLIHSSALLGLVAWPLSRMRRGRFDVVLVGTMVVIAAARVAGFSILERMIEPLGMLDARLALYLQFATTGVTEAAEPVSVRTVLVWLVIVTSYAASAQWRTAADVSHAERSRLEVSRSSLLTLLRLIVIGQIALFLFADVKEIAVRTMEFWMACLPLYAVLLAQTRGMRLPSLIVWLWLAATFGNFVFRAPALVAPYSFAI